MTIKKRILLNCICYVLLILLLVGCGTTKTNINETADRETVKTEAEEVSDGKTIESGAEEIADGKAVGTDAEKSTGVETLETDSNEAVNAKATEIGTDETARNTAETAESKVEELSKSDEVLKAPPKLKLHDTLSSNMDDSIVLTSGNYEWNYSLDENAEEMTSLIACGAAPMEEAKMAERHSLPNYDRRTTEGVIYSISASVEPDSLTIQEYYITDIGNGVAEALSEEIYDNNSLFYLQPDRIYVLKAEWNRDMFSENGFYGNAEYVLVTAE